MAFFQATGISKVLGDQPVLRPMDLSFDQHQIIAIAGETGSGKTTLLKMIAGLIEPDSGTLTLAGKKVLGPSDKLIPGDPRIAYLSQYFELRNHYRVEEELDVVDKLSPQEGEALLAWCQVAHLTKRYTHQLSGGEKQRIATARALLAKPQLLLLDEPFSNLDPFHKKIMQQVIADLQSHLHITVILVDHDPRDTLSQASRILVLRQGALVQEGTPMAVYQSPANAYVASLFGSWSSLPEAWTTDPHRPFAILRPEQLYMDGNQTGGLSGRVVRSLYFGAYYEVTVDTGTELLHVQASSAFEAGTLVQVFRKTVHTQF